MKHASRTKKQPQAKPAPVPPAQSSLKYYAALGLCLVVACVGTWAIMEYVVWNKLPANLIGKWVVQGGDQDGATFDFYRNGTMEGHINLNGKEGIIKADVAVEDGTLYIKTKNPRTGAIDTKTQTIKSLNARELVFEDERKNVLRMERAYP